MEIYFDYKGDPIGGKVTNYLLEKSRVVSPAPSERSFHIFYQLIAGCSSEERAQFNLQNPDYYNYLRNSGCYTVERTNDREEFTETVDGMQAIGMNNTEIGDVFRILSAILLIGNIEYTGKDKAAVQDSKIIDNICKLLNCDKTLLNSAMIARTFTAQGKEILTPLTAEQARYTRDSFAKTVYFRLFDYVVARVNDALAVQTATKQSRTFGVLDIYGFEIFEINYGLCNSRKRSTNSSI